MAERLEHTTTLRGFAQSLIIQSDHENSKGGEHSGQTYKTPLQIAGASSHLNPDDGSDLVRMVTNLSSYIVGPLMLFILGFGIYSAVQQRWTSVAILAVSEVLCVAVMFFAFSVVSALEGMRDFLVSFVHS